MACISIEVLQGIAGLADLAADSHANTNRMVSRLMEEWNDGTNRFNRAGETMLAAVMAGNICGVCGLNVDPFAGDVTVGRVRRLYVAVAHRRKGIGSAIMTRLMLDARKHFKLLHLRTHECRGKQLLYLNGFFKN